MKKTVKIVLWILCILILLFFATVAILPTWVSTTSGQQTLLKWINANIDGHLKVENIELNWFGKQRIQNFNFEDKEGEVVLSFDLFETDTSLFYLLFGGRKFNDTLLKKPYLVLEEETEEPLELVEKEKKEKVKRKRRREWRLPTFDEKLSIQHGTLIFSSRKMAPITISEIEIEKQTNPDAIQLKALTQQGEIRGNVSIESKGKEQIATTVKISDFPIAVFDQLFDASYYTEALGPTLNLDIQLERIPNQTMTIKGTATSANLSAYIEGSTEEKKFYVSPETRLEFTLTPTFFKHLLEENEWSLASKTKLAIQIEKGIFPLNLKKLDFQNIVLQAHASIERAELNHKKLGTFSLNKFDGSIISLKNLDITYQGEIQGKELAKIEGFISVTPQGDISFSYNSKGFPVSLLELASPSLAKNVALLFGNQFDLSSEGIYRRGRYDAKFQLQSFDTQVKGRVKGKYPELAFEITGTHTVHGDKTKVLGNSLNFSFDGKGNLEKNTVVIPFMSGKIYNQYLDFDFRGSLGEKNTPFALDQVQLIATGIFKEAPSEEGMALKDATILLQVDGSKNLIYGKAKSRTLEAQFEMSHYIQNGEFKLDEATITFSCDLNNFPLALVSPFIAKESDLSIFFGSNISLKAEGSYSPLQDPRFILDLDAKGEGFFASLSVAVDGTLSIQQNKPARIHWEMTPERYTALMQILRPGYTSAFVLTRSVPIDLKIAELSCPPTLPKDVSFICQIGFVGDIHLGTMVFRSLHTNESIVIQETSGEIQGENFSQSIDLALSGSIVAPNIPQGEKSAFSFTGQMINFWTPDGKFNREGLTVKGVLNLDLLPVRQLTGIMPLEQETREIIQAVLGELVNARIYGEISQLSGPLTIDIKSTNFKTKLPIQLHPHAIYLTDFVDAEITLTEAVNETLLKDIAPLFLTGARSDHPIKVYIEPDGFMIPLRPYSLQQVQIGKAIFDIGKIQVRNGGQVQALMQFLKAKEVSAEGWMEAWFTPIFMNLKDGVASYKRFDALLAENVHIALWGAINLLNNKVNMTLAIAPATLQQRFEILGLTKKDMFQVKMRGTTDKLELDWSAATTRIGFIIARTAGGGIGYIVGGLLEQIVTAFGEEPAPPPTTDPLPWESQYPSLPGEVIPQEALPKKNGRKGVQKLMEFLIP